MHSFDFYDTLATRLVANPADIFALVGERLGVEDFAAMRIDAERRARRRVIGGEIALAEIYDELELPRAQKDRARSLELELELKLISPISSMTERFQPGDLIISDMYHDREFYALLMEKVMPEARCSDIFISGEHRKSKARGDMWGHVKAAYPALGGHFGDNVMADVRQARKHGLRATHYRGTAMNRFEARLAGASLDGSLLAGVSRATRTKLISDSMDETEQAIIEAFASVFAPMLYAFVEWIWDECVRQGLARVYFLARDGYLPYLIFSELNMRRGGRFRCRYVYGSRHSLHIPGFTTIDSAETWLLDNSPRFTLRDLSQRADLPVDLVVAAAKGIVDADPDQNLEREERGRLAAVIRKPSFEAGLRAVADGRFRQAWRYYSETGIMDAEPAALVDIGWNGRMQSSLRRIAEKGQGGSRQLVGFYLCLSWITGENPHDHLIGFLANPSDDRSTAFSYDNYRAVLEAALSADHATTLGFEDREGMVEPVLGVSDDEPTLRRIRLQHRTVRSWLENLLVLEQATGRRIEVPCQIVPQNLREYLEFPTRRDSLAFLDFAMVSGQNATQTEPVAEIVGLRRALGRRGRQGRWTEGSLAASGLSILGRARFIRHMLVRRAATLRGGR